MFSTDTLNKYPLYELLIIHSFINHTLFINQFTLREFIHTDSFVCFINIQDIPKCI